MKQCTVCQREYSKKKTFCPYDGTMLVLLEDGDPLIDKIIDYKYRIDHKIAEGGMGNVYRATHLHLNSPVAIKVLHSNLVSDSTAVERFRREAQAAMKIHHTNAILIMDFGVSQETIVYLVMEYLTGCTLRQRLKELRRFSISETNRILQPVCSALNAAHKRKIVHRDLKPENIFMQIDQESGEEIVKVLDFGIAKLKDKGGALTRVGMVVGTPHYMSPEQCYASEVDSRSDIYSIGIIAYEMLTGRPPFEGNSSVQLAIKQTTEKPKPVYELRPEIPDIINDVIMHTLEKSPEDRPQTILDFAAEFEVALRYIDASSEDNPALAEEEASAITYVVHPAPVAAPAAAPVAAPAVQPAKPINAETPKVRITEPDSELTREAVKDHAPIHLPVSEAATYPVICENCRMEVGRSIVPGSTIVCPTCRSLIRESGSLLRNYPTDG